MESFVHLDVATAFSAHYGTSWPQDLVDLAADDGAEAAACVDRDGLYGAVKHVAACRARGMGPILGADLAVVDERGTSRGRVVLLAGGSAAGYAALCRAVSAAHGAELDTASATPSAAAAGATPRLGLRRLVELARGEADTRPAVEGSAGSSAGNSADGSPALFVLLGPESDVGRAAASRRYAEARRLLRGWRALLGPQALRVEVVSHLAPPGEALSTAHAARMLGLAEDVGVGAVLTNMVRFAHPDEATTADVLDAVRVLSSLQSTASLQPTGQGWLKPTAQMHRIAVEITTSSAGARTDAARLLEDTRALAARCVLDPEEHLSFGRPKIPEHSVIGLGRGGAGADPMRELAQRCRAGLGERFPQLADGGARRGSASAEEVHQRLDQELSVIEDLGFAGYFLTVAEVVAMVERMGVRVSARGSGASSLVNHLLRISAVDPIEHDLVFERFLSRRRSTLPDIDIDVESARRHEVYHRIVERFGGERTTLMSMQNSYRIRGAVRDAGLALGMDDGEIDQIAETMWRFPAGEFREALTEKPELRALAERLESDRAAGRRQLDLLVDLTERLDRLPRHISTHPCGIILGDRRLPELTPVQPSGVDGLPMSQFDKHDMDPMGFLKLDVLGVRMQSTIAHTLEEIRRTTGERIDLEAIDRDDPDTYRMIRSTHTLGCFQIESPGQRELVGKLMPESLTDLIVDISLFRPGPMGSGMVTPYLERRHGFESVRVPHPDLAPILAETHGVTIYHEQVLRLLDTMTGCGLDRADELRRALGSAEQPQVEEFVRTCAAQRGYEAGVVDEVWEVLASFGSFGFCKAHGAAFAVPTVESAWLKTHHPAAFLTGLFEHDPGMYPLRLLVAEARRLGVPLLGMDVNRSTDHYRLEELEGDDGAGGGSPRRPRHGIRMALTSLKGIGDAEITRIAAAQPFASVADLRRRARPRRPTLRALAQVGALDALMPGGAQHRGDLVSAVAEQTRTPREAATSRSAGRQAAGQLPLPFAETDLAGLPAEHPAPERQEMIADELRLTDLDVTGHVMELHRETLEQLGVTRAEDLLTLRSGSTVRVAGIRVATQTPPMASGRRVVFISLDDGTGCADVAFFDEAQGNTGEILFTAQLMLVEGTIRRTGPRAVSIQALDAWDLRREDQLAALRRRRVPEPPRRGRGQQGRVNASPL